MEITSPKGTNVLIQPCSKAPTIYDNPIDAPASLVVDYLAYSAKFFNPKPLKQETFKFHYELFLVFSSDEDSPIEVNINTNIQTSSYKTYDAEYIEEVRWVANQILEFYVIHYFENNSKKEIYESLVAAISATNNPLYSIFYYDRDLLVTLANKTYFIPKV